MRGLQFALVSPALLLIACGGDTRLVAPDNVSPALRGVAIAGADAILTGVPTPYTASGSFSNGTSGNVTATWRSSNPAVATVDPTGLVEGRSQGSAMVTASYMGRDVSKRVEVVNNYGGRWEGQYRVLSCQDSGDLTDHDGGWCRTAYTPGRGYRITIDIAHDPGDPASVTVRLWDESYRGSVGSDGRLTVAGISDVLDWDRDVVAIREIHAEAGLSPDGAVTGRFQESYNSILFRKGTARMEHELLTMTRTTPAGAAMPLRSASGR
jgi:hypothetical protein